jgi:hypothetical protein
MWKWPIELFNYTWSYNSSSRASGRGSTVNQFSMPAEERKVILDVVSSDITESLNDLQAIVEVDILNNTPGKLFFGEQYTTGFFIGSLKPDKIEHYLTSLELTFLVSIPAWITEASTEFITFSESSEVGKRFPYKFPHRYATAGIRTLINEHYAPTPAIITIYGPALDPSISIDGQIYQMNISMATGERLIFDGLNRRIYRKLITGEEVNEFNRRDKNNDPFRPIPPGTLPVVYNGSFSFDITLIQQRSEPRWGG